MPPSPALPTAGQHEPRDSSPPAWVRESPGEQAERLGISIAAADLFAASEVIDLHIDSFIWNRLFGYRLDRRHGRGLFNGAFYSQVDLPRLRQVGMAGATWVITTNPFRGAGSRERTFRRNLEQLSFQLSQHPRDVRLVRTLAEYKAARELGVQAAFIGIQGGNALDAGLDSLDAVADGRVLRITLVHLSGSKLGQTSTPNLSTRDGLSNQGVDYIRRLNELKIAVDLAHISRKSFFDALDAHSKDLPILVSHTALSGVHSHFRNIDDEQLRALKDRGGLIGIMYHSLYLGEGLFPGRVSRIADHIVHAVNTVGENYVALGSDWDGAIVTPRDMPTCLELPRLVEALLQRKLRSDTIQKILGENFLRFLGDLRGHA